MPMKRHLGSGSVGRLRGRHVRWAALVGVAPALWACTAHRLEEPTPQVERMNDDVFEQSLNRNIDIVFEVDNSLSMDQEQANLVENFPVFIDILKKLPGGLPNVHIAVVTSDMGAGAFSGQVGGCGNPDNGVFVDTARAATDPVCATAHLNAGQHFISSADGGTNNNFTGDIADVFRCLAQVGTTGCGFESHLESVRAALGDDRGDPAHGIPARPVPANNVGFLRADAFLAVISITNEGECSVPPDSVLFDPDAAVVPTLGPLQTRCLSHTDRCDGRPVLAAVQAGQPAGPFQTCVADDDAFAADPKRAAIPVPFYVDYFKRRKTDPSKVFLSGIIAPPSPYALVIDPTSVGGTGLKEGNSCTGAGKVFGQATPRMTEFFAAFNAQQTVTTSICDGSYANAMTSIANQLSKGLGSPCIPGKILDVTGTKGTRPDCSVVDHAVTSDGEPTDTALFSCVDTGGAAPCWKLVPGTDISCPGAQIMQFVRPTGQLPPTSLNSTVQCAVAICAAGEHSPDCP
jgi:hypothetical protein